MKNPSAKNLLSTILKSLSIVLIFLFLAAFLSGCGSLDDPETSQEYRSHVVARVNSGQTAGQTLIAYRPRLNSISSWIRVIPSNDTNKGFIRINIYHATNEKVPILSIPLSFHETQNFFPYTINFPSVEENPNPNYYIEFEVIEGELLLFGRNENAYSRGQLYLDQQPIQSDISFRSTYDYDFSAILNDIWKLLKRFGLIIPLFLVLWLPGATFHQLLFPQTIKRNAGPLDLAMKTAIAIGFSLAIIPIMVLWFPILKVLWSRQNVFLIFGLFLVLFIYLNRVTITNFVLAFSESSFKSKIHKIQFDPVQVFLAVIFIITLGSRLLMVRDLTAPAWVDSVHHAVVTNTIIEQKSYPTNYEPYLYGNNTSYHAGFHTILATFILLSGLKTPDAMLFFGQVLNALTILAVFFFTSTLLKNKTIGVIAALIPAFFSSMPAYYTSWGRYTQLTGLLILPIGIYYINNLLNTDWDTPLMTGLSKPTWLNWRLLAATTVLSAGLFLTHVRVFIFLIQKLESCSIVHSAIKSFLSISVQLSLVHYY